MTVKQTIDAIKELGMNARHISETNEYRVNYQNIDSRWRGEDTAYYTDDSQDAIETANAMKVGR